MQSNQKIQTWHSVKVTDKKATANFGRAGSVRQVAPDPAKPDEELIHVQLDGDAPGELTAFRAEQLTVL